MKKILIVLILCLAMVIPPTTLADQALLQLRDYFAYVPDDGELHAIATQNENSAYLAQIDALIRNADFHQQDSCLSVNVHQTLAVDHMTALAWQSTNRCDTALYVQCNETDARYNDVEYDLCCGICWQNYVILPGQTLDARFEGVLWESVPARSESARSGTFFLNMRIYALPDSILIDAQSEDFSPEEAGLTLLEKFTLRVPMEMQFSPIRSALPDGLPVEQDFGAYALRITQADMDAIGARFAYERIYATEADARADAPTGDTFWDYRFPASNGAVWIESAYGVIPDDPIELPDGRWAWQRTFRVYFLYAQPETVLMQCLHFDGAQYSPVEGECVLLTFSDK